MKLKGINPIEQHVEKIVLGLVGLVFVGVLAMQFLVSPNRVEYENQKVPPDRVFELLGDRAETLLGQMTDPEPELPDVETPDLASRFESGFETPLVPDDRLVAAPLGEPLRLSIGEVENLDGPVTPLELPDPGDALVASQWSTVDPFFAASVPSMDPYLPDEQPLDKVTVSVEAVIDGKAVGASLERVEDGRRAIPTHWWTENGTGLIEVLSVQVQRQSQNPDGSWSDPEPVENVRWSPDVLGAYNEDAPEGQTVAWDSVKPADLRAMARMAQDDPALVAQPEFLPTIAGVEWVAPSKVAEREKRLETLAMIERIENEITGLEEAIAKIQERKKNRPTRDPNRSSSRGGGGGGGVILGGGGGPRRSSGSTRTTGTRTDPLDKQIEAKQKQIASKQEELDALYEELGDDAGAARQARRPRPTAPNPAGRPGGGGPVILGGGGGPVIIGGGGGSDPRVGRGSRSTGRRSGRSLGADSPGPLVEQDKYEVWMHDLTAEPGAVYRYRLRYGVNNPLFGREKSVGDDASLIALAGEPLVFSPWTAWSEPVHVGRKDYFFVTSAREQGQLNRQSASATAEVYRVVYGYYRKHTVTLQPGDVLEGTFHLPEDLPLFTDIKKIDSDALNRYFDEREAEGSDQPAAGRLQPANPDEEPEERPWLSFMPTEQNLPLDAVMLDVAEYPIVPDSSLPGERSRRLFEVFFFDPLVGIASRRPDRDRSMDEYEAVARSARLSETAEIRRPDPKYLP